jgi:hypothetical protein
MAFDPDAYLAKKPSFNPDEYLKSKPTVVEPILSPEEQVMGAIGAPSEGIASLQKPGVPKPPSELAMGEELGKGLGAGFIGLKSTAENVGLMKDIGAMSTVQQRQDLFNKIETGQITSPDQLRGLDQTSGLGRAYLVSDPATREKLRERNVGEIGRRTDFVKTSLSAIDQYQKDAQKYQGRTTDLTDVEGAKDFANWLAFNFGSGAVQLAPLMLAAVTTGGAGVALLGTSMGTGEAIGNRLEFLQEKIKSAPELSPNERAAMVIDYVKKTGDTSLAVGIVSGALDSVLGPAATLAKRGLGEVVKGETRKEALKAGVKEIPKGMGQEFITGGAQEATQLGGALAEKEIDEFLTKENAKKILNAAAAEAAGSIGGGAITTGTRVYGADRAIRAKEKRDAEIQALQGQMSELDDLLKTVYEGPPSAEPTAAAPTPAPAPVAPEAGIAGLMPQAAPVQQPAAPVAEEDQPAQDLDAMLKEALAATGSDIITDNMLEPQASARKPELDQAQVTAMSDEQLQAQVKNINLRDREYELVKTELESRQAQPPSTQLLKEVLPKPELSDKFGVVPAGEYSAEGTFEQDGRKWKIESIRTASDGFIANTTDKGEPVRRAFRIEDPFNPKLQELLDINNQLAKIGKTKETTYDQLNKIIQDRASFGTFTADQFIDRSIAQGKEILSKQKPAAKPAAPAVNPKVQDLLELENQSRENRGQKPMTYAQAEKMVNDDVENNLEFGDFDSSVKQLTEEARNRLEYDSKITAPTSTVNISKTGEMLRGKPFTPDELDKKAIEIYKKIKAANPEADLDEEIVNPNRFHPVKEEANSKGFKIGDLLYKKGNPNPYIATTIYNESVKLVNQNTGRGGFENIDLVSKEPIPYDYNFNFGYGEIDVNVNEWNNNKNQWQFSMYGPGASDTGFRSELGIQFKGTPGTKEFDNFVEAIVSRSTADRPQQIAKAKKEAEKNMTPEQRKQRKEQESAADKERLAKESAESDERVKARNELLGEIQEHMKKNKIGIYSPMPSLKTAMETIEKLKKGNKTDPRAEGWMKGQGIIWTPEKNPQFTRMGKRFVQEVYKLNQKLTEEQRASGTEDATVLKAAVDKANAITEKERKKAIADKQKAIEAQNIDKAKIEQADQDIEKALGDLAMLITKGTRLNMMPEDEQKLMPILTTLMDASFRKGYYKFKEAARYVMDLIRSQLGHDFADEITLDQLQGAYIGMAGRYQEQGASSKKEVIAVESLSEIDEVSDEAVTEEAGEMDINNPSGRFEVAQNISQFFLNNGDFRDITEARKMISEMTGQDIKAGTRESKMTDEAIEAGVVMAARNIVDAGRQDKLTSAQIFDQLVDLYDRQPNLSGRSSTSVAEQAYSTPAPLAYVASELAGINKKTAVYEPTAGNGMLLIGASENNITANELNPDRFEMLSRILEGSEIGNENALDSNVKGADFDVVIENPPFGKAGNISDIDHAIAMHSLEGMKEDGRAVLILGGVQANTEEGRREGYRGKAKREFYYKLYNEYNVVDHFTAGGNMYAKQGTTYPVDVIVIEGRGKSQRNLPAADLPELITSYEQLKEKLNDRMVSRGDSGTGRVDGGEGGERRVEPEGVDRGTVGEGESTGGERGRPAGDGERGVSEAESARGGQREPSGGRAGEVQPRPTDESERDAEGRPVSGTGKRGEAGGKAGAEGRKPSELGGVSVVSGERVGSGLTERAKKEEETTNQVSYTPHSQATAVGTLVPKAMAQAIEDSIAKVEAEVGNIDEFVAEQLEMDPETLREQFSAEQIDALVLAIRNAEEGKGFIIGDQTGVGKGRVVAAMIKYALNTGKIPIFVTEKPNLYSDMIRDLDDIGMTNELGLDTAKPRIFMTNSSGSVPYTLIRTVKGEPVENNLMLKPVKSSGLDEVMKQMVKNNSLGNYKVIFTTYSQLQSVKGKPTERQYFIKHFGANNYMIFDESHNAGGAGADISQAAKDAGIIVGMGRAGFVRELVKSADGTFFSSATYAKRPDVMDLYSSTDMKLAVDKISQLSDAIKAGGIPMQQTVANMLTQVGQYIRRERTFAGVSYNTQETKVDKDTAENMATSMRDILAFSREKEGVVKNLQKSLDAQGARASAEGEKTTVQGANFGSIMHNLIDQMLLSLKAQDSVRHAIERLKAGEKVVLTVSNTMGAFLKNYADDMDIKVGDPVNLSFADLYIRYLDKQRMVTITKPGGVKEQYRLTDEDLGPNLVNRYYEITNFIRGAGFGSAPISPIDYMHSELRKAGYKTEEITGRTATLNYESGKPLLTTRSANIKQRVNAVKSFNNGDSDVIILNQAGSTGLSLHAKASFKDKRKRHMIIVQPEKNIDTHMQMLGRVHRTGQVIAPAYSQMMADIPAEMRPAAVLLKKMASLNANTTASRKSAVSAEGAVDFMNDYGGQVAQEFLRDNPGIHGDLGGNKIAQVKENTEDAGEEDIRKLTGYIPILPLKVQEEVYKDLIERYNELIEREDSMGSNKLEAKAQDLDAQTVSSVAITEDKGEPSIFAQPAYMEKVDVRRTVRPYSKDEVKEQVKEALDGKTPAEYSNDLKRSIDEPFKKYYAERIADAEASSADPIKLIGIRANLNSDLERVQTILDTYRLGTPVAIKNVNGVFVYGVVSDIRRKGKTKNPAAGSDWKMTLSLANGDAKSLPLTFSQIGSSYMLDEQPEIQYLNPDTLENERIPLMDLFDRGATVRREKRWMVTGNILSGFAEVNNMGTILSYTKNDGTTGQGILMPRTFDFEKQQKNAPVRLRTANDVMRFFGQFGRRSMVSTPDAVLRIKSEGYGSLEFITSSSKREGGTFFLDKGLTDIVGDFYKRGSVMSAAVYNEAKSRQALEYILNERQESLIAASDQDKAREMFAPKDIPLSSIKFDNERLSINPAMNRAIDREILIRQYQAVRQKSAAISAKFAKGEAGLDEQKALTFLKQSANDLKEDIKDTKPAGRLAKNFFAKATADWNKDLISDDVYDVIRTLHDKYPDVLEGLQFSIKKQPEGKDVIGDFFPFPRIVRLYKGTTGVVDPEAIRHEIVHSLEQMMEAPAVRALVDDWSDKLGAAIKAEKSAAGQKYFRNVLEMLNSPSLETYQTAIDSMPSMNYYQYLNPSEYWAVNAEKLMARKLGTGWDKFVLAAKRLFEGLKFMFGFDNQYIVQRTFNDIMNSRQERFHTRSLNNYITKESIPLANMVKNYKGGAGALATWESAEDTSLTKFQYQIVDKQVDTRMVVKSITEQIGDIQDQHDPSLQETLYHSAKSEKVKDFLKDNLRPFVEQMRKMGVEYRDFEHYLHMRHAKVRNEIVAKRNPAMPDGGSGIFNQEVDDYFAGKDNSKLTPADEAKYKELAKTVDDWVKETQDLLIQYGLEKPETIAAWREKLPFYVPLKRDPDELDYVTPGSGLGQGFATRGNFSKTATGSYKTVVDVLANIALQREAAIIRGEKAKIGRALYALAIQNPNPNFWKPVNPDAIRNKKKLKEEMASFNLTVAEADALFAEPPSPSIDPATGLVEYKVNTALRNSPNVFAVRVNGEDRFIFFNPGEPRAKRMAEALKNLDANQLGEYLGTVAEATRLIAAVNTQYNPVFGAWNFARDVVGGTINLSSTEIADRKMQVLAGSIPALRAIFTDLRGMKESVAGIVSDSNQKEWIALWNQFREIGGVTGYSEQFSRAKEKASIVDREMARLDRGNARRKADAVMDWLSDYNDAMENAVRLSAFKAGLDKGMTPQRAAALAKNLTVNFNRKGQATANANALYAFFNARVQGTTRMMDVLVQNKDGKFTMTSVGKKIIAGGMLLGSMQALALMAAGFDGDEPPDFLKDKNLILPTFGLTGEKKYLIVPMPLGWNLFPNIGRELTEYVLINSGQMKGRRKITQTIVNISAQIADMFNPLGAGGAANLLTPTLADPFVNVLATNKDAFGRPISRESRETTPTPGWERSRDNATSLSKALAYGLNYLTGGGEDGIGLVSPTADQLDYLAKEYAGGVGREITKAVRYIGKKIEGEEDIPSYSVPIFGKLYGELDTPSAAADKFYKNVKAMAEHEGTIKRIKERKGDVSEYRNENKEATARLINRANYVETEVARYNREIRAMYKKEAPEKEIKAKKEKRDAVMKAYNEEVRRAQ